MSSGTTTRNFSGRHTEHGEDALLNKKSEHSLFHLTYPRKDAAFDPESRQGWFEDLTQYVGLGFDPQNSAAMDTIVNTAPDGMFVWPAEMLEFLAKSDRCGNSMALKQRFMVSYLFEIFYDLALDPTYNVSVSPDFEAYLKEFRAARAADQAL